MGKKLFVGNLAWGVREADLRGWLDGRGFICEKAEVIVNHDTGRSRGFGFLHFATEAAAEEVKRELDDVELDGRPVHLEEAVDRRSGRGSGGKRGGERGGRSGRSGNFGDGDDWA